MSFRMRGGRASFSVGPRGPRASYRLGVLLPAAIVATVLALAAWVLTGRWRRVDSSARGEPARPQGDDLR
jgi:hypothetical protein